MGRHFVIRTDHKPLKYLFGKKLTTPTQYTWLAKLMALDFEIQYKQGQSSKVVDTLYRINFSEAILYAIFSISVDILDKVKASWEKYHNLLAVIQSLQNGNNVKYYQWKYDQLFRKGKLAVSDDQELKQDLLYYFHDSVV